MIVGTAIGRDVGTALADEAIPVLEASVLQRVGFAESAVSGSTVLELEPKGHAAGEILVLIDEVLAL